MVALLLSALLLIGELHSDAARNWYGELLAQGGYGRTERERAAFLIRERHGNLTLAPWTARAHRRASFKGLRPENAIAILHTHPAAEPEPSRHDANEAQRIGLPVVVVTPDRVVAAMPDGTRRELFGRGWDRPR